MQVRGPRFLTAKNFPLENQIKSFLNLYVLANKKTLNLIFDK